MGRSIVPSGASTGEHEALELRDGDKKRYLGKGVLKAVSNVNNIISPALKGQDATLQSHIDQLMFRWTERRTRASSAPTRCSAFRWRLREPPRNLINFRSYRYIGGVKASVLPAPMMNIVNGGAHADNNVDLQEFMIMPVGAPIPAGGGPYGSRSFSQPKEDSA